MGVSITYLIYLYFQLVINCLLHGKRIRFSFGYKWCKWKLLICRHLNYPLLIWRICSKFIFCQKKVKALKQINKFLFTTPCSYSMFLNSLTNRIFIDNKNINVIKPIGVYTVYRCKHTLEFITYFQQTLFFCFTLQTKHTFIHSFTHLVNIYLNN